MIILRFIFILGLAMSSLFVNAQYQGFKNVNDMVSFRKIYAQESQKIQNIGSTFVQEKKLSALTESIRSEGKFWFKKDSRLRIEYIKPSSYLIVMNGEKVKITDKGVESKVNTASSKVFREINKVILDCIQGSILDSKDFTTKVFENEKGYLLEMTPVAKAMKGFFNSIVLNIDKSDFTARSITMNEPSGDNTVITFSAKKVNQGVSDSLFEF